MSPTPPPVRSTALSEWPQRAVRCKEKMSVGVLEDESSVVVRQLDVVLFELRSQRLSVICSSVVRSI